MEVVAHPETGRPAVVETHYRELELTTEQEKAQALEAQLAEVNTRHEQVSSEKAALESQLNEQKSLVAGIEALAPDAGAEASTEGTSGEVEDTTAPEEAQPVF